MIKGLRFSLMKQEDLASAVLDSEILIEEEILTVVKQFSSSCLVELPETKRFGGDIQRCCRFGSVTSWYGYSYNSSVNAINLSVDKDVTLVGVCLFGSELNSYSIDLKVEEGKRKVVCKNGQFFSEPFQSTPGCYDGLEVLLDRGITLKKNTTYFIEAKITGPRSRCGDKGVSRIVCSGVTFTFMNNEYCDSTYSTSSLKWGQFAELLFSL